MRTPAAVVDTRGIAPTPERLLLIVDFLLSAGVRSLFFDFGDRFPWSIDSRLAGPDAFPDDMIAETDRRCTRREVSTHLLFRSLFPSRLASVPTYRRLLRGADRGTRGPLPGSACKLLGDIVEDAIGLMPALSGICWIAGRNSLLPEPGSDDIRRVVSQVGLRAATLVTLESEAASGANFGCTGDEETFPVLAADDVCDESPLGRSIETRVPAIAAGLLRSQESHDASRLLRELGDFSDCARCANEIEGYWERAWRSIGRLHGLLSMSGEDPGLRGPGLAQAARDLRDCVGRAGHLEKELVHAYSGRATSEAVRRHLRPHIAAVREQHAALQARAAHLRSLDHFVG